MCAGGIEREKREVVIYLPDCKIEGRIEFPRGALLSDFITLSPRKFVTVFNATVSATRAHETWEYRVEKLNINRDYIVTIFSRAGMKPVERGEKDVKEP